MACIHGSALQGAGTDRMHCLYCDRNGTAKPMWLRDAFNGVGKGIQGFGEVLGNYTGATEQTLTARLCEHTSIGLVQPSCYAESRCMSRSQVVRTRKS